MSLSKFEKILPWSGLVTGICWIGQTSIGNVGESDEAGAATASTISANLGLTYARQGFLVLAGITLLFFAAAVRNLLRSAEPREATYSSVAYAGWLVVVAAISQMVMLRWGLANGAAEANDQAAVHVLGYTDYFAWAGMGIGLATALVAMGLAGVSNAVLPKWFAIVSIVLGVLAALGNAGIPPGGAVNYVLFPFWLVVASIVVARRQRMAAAASFPAPRGERPGHAKARR